MNHLHLVDLEHLTDFQLVIYISEGERLHEILSHDLILTLTLDTPVSVAGRSQTLFTICKSAASPG